MLNDKRVNLFQHSRQIGLTSWFAVQALPEHWHFPRSAVSAAVHSLTSIPTHITHAAAVRVPCICAGVICYKMFSGVTSDNDGYDARGRGRGDLDCRGRQQVRSGSGGWGRGCWCPECWGKLRSVAALVLAHTVDKWGKRDVSQGKAEKYIFSATEQNGASERIWRV